MTPVETLAVIFAAAVLIKAILFTTSSRRLIKMAEAMSEHAKLLAGTLLVVAVVVGFYVIRDVGVVEVVAVMLLAHLLIGMFLVLYPKSYMKMAKDVMKRREKTVLAWLVYLALSIWACYVIFF